MFEEGRKKYMPALRARNAGKLSTAVSGAVLLALAYLFYPAILEAEHSKVHAAAAGCIGICILALSFFEISFSGKIRMVVRELLLIGYAIAGCFMFDIVNIGTGTLSVWRLFINTVPVYITERLILCITNSLKAACIIAGVLCFTGSVANYYVYTFRGRPVLPWDFGSIGTAVSVLEGYTFDLELSILYAALLLLFLVQAGFFFKCSQKTVWSKTGFLLNAGVTAGLAVLYTLFVYPKLADNLWDMEQVYEEEGVVAGFISHSKYMKYQKPSDYSDKKAEELLARVDLETADSTKETAKNIIVVMNESFTDFRLVGKHDLEGDYMPYIDSLEGNVIKGKLYVPVFGGGTCDTEFEVLTGISGSTVPMCPYQTAFNHKVNSLVSVMNEQGFYTEAFHPYIPENWNRKAVYSYLGFDKFRSSEDMETDDSEIVRWCLGDYRDYQEIISSYEAGKGEPFFMFNITMQNHGGYIEEFDNFTNTVDFSEYGDFKGAETFLSLIKESDKQLKGLIEYFSAVEEPTLICFFGDHQPAIEEEFYEMLFGKPLAELSPEERQERFVTPILLWSNYEMNPVNIDRISSNYLEALILKQANISMPAYESFLWQLFEEYPVFSVTGVRDRDDNYYELLEGIGLEKIREYSWLQYHRLKRGK